MSSIALTVAASGDDAASIKFDFSKPPKYGFFNQTWKYGGTCRVERIVYDLKRPYRRKMAVRMTDATGQTFHKDIAQYSQDWVRHEVAVEGRWTLHFGGAKDGTVHHPIRDFQFLVLGGKDGAISGEALVKNVEFREAPPHPAPVLKISAKVESPVPPEKLNLEVKTPDGAFSGGRIDVCWTDWDGGVISEKTATVPPVQSGGVWRSSLPYPPPPEGRNAVFCNATFSHSGRTFEYEAPAWTAPVSPFASLPWQGRNFRGAQASTCIAGDGAKNRSGRWRSLRPRRRMRA